MAWVNPYDKSLNQRATDAANAAGAREQAHDQVMSAWKILADREYYRSIPLNQRATDAANLVKLRRQHRASGVSKAHKAKVPGVQQNPDTATASAQSSAQRTAAYAEYADTLTKYGFKRGEVMQFLKGLTYTQLQNPALVTQAFRETGTWRERFGGVTKSREKNGMSYLNEGEIIQLEDTYRQIFTAAGIPEKFWEQDDLNNLIGQDVSPQEVADRVKLAEDAINNTDPAYTRAFREYYGIGKKSLVGYMLNRKKGVQLLSEQVKAAEIGAEAGSTGMDSVGKKFAEKLVDKDISRQEARQAFANVADTKQD